MVPVVLGAAPQDYAQVAPPGSFIHVDSFGSTKELAEYLKYLDQNGTAYMEYFEWQKKGRLVWTHYLQLMCRVCALAHAVRLHGNSSVPGVHSAHSNSNSNSRESVDTGVYRSIEKWWKKSAKAQCLGKHRRWETFDSD